MLLNSNIAVIAFDPGVTTGVCVCEGVHFYSGSSFTVTYSACLAWQDRRNIYYALQRLRAYEEAGDLYLNAIVIERFKLFAKEAQSQVGSEFPAVQVLARIEAYAELLGFEDRIHMLEPSVKGRVQILPQHKPQLDLSTEHTKDAYQLARYYITQHKPSLKKKR